MIYSRSLFERLPEVARFADNGEGVLTHVVNAVQPALDIFVDRIETEEYLYDWETCPPAFLDWLGQLVGLTADGSHFLGIGLNPAWSIQRKRELISRAWIYWQIAGTNMGVREAIALWLDWPAARDPVWLEIIQPFGDRSLTDLPNWWSYQTPYDWNLLQSIKSNKRLGSGADPQGWFQPLWSDGVLSTESIFNGLTPGSGSAIGPNRPWLHHHLNLEIWVEVTTQIGHLCAEIYSTEADPVIVAWLDFIDDIHDPDSGGDSGSSPADTPTIAVSPSIAAEICRPIEAGYVPATVIPDPLGTGSFDPLVTPPVNGQSAALEYLCRNVSDIFDLYPTLKRASISSNWTLTVATDTESYAVKPISLYFMDAEGSPSVEFSWIDGRDRVYLEFVFAINSIQRWQELRVLLDDDIVFSYTFDPPLLLTPGIYNGCQFGFQFFDPQGD